MAKGNRALIFFEERERREQLLDYRLPRFYIQRFEQEHVGERLVAVEFDGIARRFFLDTATHEPGRENGELGRRVLVPAYLIKDLFLVGASFGDVPVGVVIGNGIEFPDFKEMDLGLVVILYVAAIEPMLCGDQGRRMYMRITAQDIG